MTDTQPKPKPLICTFRELAAALYPLHLNTPADLNRLHDIWKMGAITPDSRILFPKHYDPRRYQPGNVERRIVFPSLLAGWIKEIANRRGLALTDDAALNVALGRSDYEVPTKPRIIKP